MTEGNIPKQIILFTLPLLFGNLFQQLYNTVDVIVVGNYVGKNALAAVGASGSIINMIVGFFMGVSTGSSAVISRFFGARDDDRLKKAVHTTFFITFVLGVVFTLIGIIVSPLILRVMKTPSEVMVEAVLYLRIYFLGIMGLMVYNMGAAVLRAVGDSKRPLYFLIIASVINIVLDIFFVVHLGMGVEGVAFATLIAQGVSAVLVVFIISKTSAAYKLIIKEIKADREILKNMLKIGLPGGVQQSVTAVSNIIVQGYINKFGAAGIAGFGSYMKLDSFLIMPTQSISLGVVSFVGQNVGAGNTKRAKKGVRVSFLISLIISISVCSIIFFHGEKALRIFSPDLEVVYYGNILVKTLMPFYIGLSTCLVYAGAMRGFGQGLPPMIVMMGSFVVLRQIYLFIALRISYTYKVLAFGYPLSWIVAGLSMYIWYRKGSFWKRSLDSEAK